MRWRQRYARDINALRRHASDIATFDVRRTLQVSCPLCTNRKMPEPLIMEVLNVGRMAVWRTRTAYLQGGLDFALHDEPRPDKPKRYEADAQAQVTALACSDPPAGAQRWTVALLTEAARRHPQMKTISRETLRRILKKTFSNRGAN